jgi:phosphomannomutase
MNGDDRETLARRWLAVDPDDDTRAELRALLEAGDEPALAERFGRRLRFGTAGLRGQLGAGPNRMNRVVVRQAATGLVRSLPAPSTVVVGHDARHKSDLFARDTAAIVAGLGGRALVLPGPVPTPLLAFAVRHLGADAGVMVTASHNPPRDNGYKVFLADGAQLVPPHDTVIERAIEAAGLIGPDLPAPAGGGSVVELDGRVADAYLDAITAGLAPDPLVADLRVVYTPLHGVGRDLTVRALQRLGCSPIVVPSQADPDPDFPTVAFPNPEEDGALDHALALADEIGAAVVIAHDPDADRLAVAVPEGGGWRRLSGDELGAILAEHILSTTTGDDRLVVTTVVSSSLLCKQAKAHGAHCSETLTGFKWVVRPALEDPRLRFVFGYEEALGYAVNDVVRDKDGIAAAVVFLEALASLRRRGLDVPGMLETMAATYGRHLTAQVSVRVDGPAAQDRLAARMAALRATPPHELGDRRVLSSTDYLEGAGGLPPADMVRLDLEGGGRVMLRPSGTEPKLKAYVEVVVPADDGTGRGQLRLLADAVSELVAQS